MKIAVTGIGYVGLSMAVLLSQHNEVVALDISPDKVDSLNRKISPISDKQIEVFLKEKQLNLRATLNKKDAYLDASFVIVAIPTDFLTNTQSFNTDLLDDVIEEILEINPNATIIIKSTVPIGYTNKTKSRLNISNLIFSPEFLREGMALHDNLYPSRIIIGENSDRGQCFANLLKKGALKKDIDILFTENTEAEAIKLFSNAYLAMRVSFFNELDTFALLNELDVRQIINGVCLDPRIGNTYNNPSFGYGGYCLPKDTKQLLSNFKKVPQNLIQAVVESNTTRKHFITKVIISKKPKIVGIYRLIMKSGSDNFRTSAIHDIIDSLKNSNVEVIVFEPSFNEAKFESCTIEKNLDIFKSSSDIVVANRISPELDDIKYKVLSRDIFGDDS